MLFKRLQGTEDPFAMCRTAGEMPFEAAIWMPKKSIIQRIH